MIPRFRFTDPLPLAAISAGDCTVLGVDLHAAEGAVSGAGAVSFASGSPYLSISVLCDGPLGSRRTTRPERVTVTCEDMTTWPRAWQVRVHAGPGTPPGKYVVGAFFSIDGIDVAAETVALVVHASQDTTRPPTPPAH